VILQEWDEKFGYKESFKKWMDDYMKEFENEKKLTIKPELSYMIVHFQLLSLLVEGGNSVNLEKCRAMHSYPFLLEILEQSTECFL
jgi:inositol 1,4,5-triphosphate receptor type 1/inositol 1,4,5-triphosphate receptor type 3